MCGVSQYMETWIINYTEKKEKKKLEAFEV